MKSKYKYLLISLTLAGISVLGYLFSSKLVYTIGYPLDDAWIHQTYARNFAYTGKWIFTGNKPSAGSTSPLWSIILSTGYFLKVNHYIWTFFLGWIILGILAGMTMIRMNMQYGRELPWIYLAGGIIGSEWHLVWSAVSGMETLLFALVVLLVFHFAMDKKKLWGILGFLVAIVIWVRPDGISLIGPVLFLLALEKGSKKSKINGLVKIFLPVIISLLIYFFYNFALSGQILPNTFFAKQAEYSSLLRKPFVMRFIEVFKPVLVGSGILILPGWFFFLYKALKECNLFRISWGLWFLGYISLYALRLPVSYQHGRYIIPAMPVFIISGFIGTQDLWLAIEKFKGSWIVSRAWIISLFLIQIVFWVLGARAYGMDVAVIETEMVGTAKWVNSNTSVTAVIAVHDIGAMGYFSERTLLDLAGLVSPEVIPIIRNEKALEEFLDVNGANYLVTFPGWYPYLVTRATKVFSTQGDFSPRLGGENMGVYLWRTP